MHIALIHDTVVPAEKYGGTERVIWWLAKGLLQRKHRITLVARPGSQFPFGEMVAHDFKQRVSVESDIHHYFSTPGLVPERPYVVTIGGNGKIGERFYRNTIFVSRDHARRHHASAFIYNGVDPDDYVFSESKERSLLFLAKASWKVKNVRGAIRIARRSGYPLDILGGSRSWLPRWRGVRWRGMQGGKTKACYLTRSTGLLFPVIWDEPFGLAVVEALMSGTPVLASQRGALPELIGKGAGFVCDNYDEFVEKVPFLRELSPKTCRDWALANFHYESMTQNYLILYERVLNDEPINESDPFTDVDQGGLKELGSPSR